MDLSKRFVRLGEDVFCESGMRLRVVRFVVDVDAKVAGNTEEIHGGGRHNPFDVIEHSA